VHSALKRGVNANMLLVDLVDFLINYSTIKEFTVELRARRKEQLHAYNGSSLLPSVQKVEKWKPSLTPYCIDMLRGQAAQASRYEVCEAIPNEFDEENELVQEVIYVVAPMEGGAQAIAAAFRAAYVPARRSGCTPAEAIAHASPAAAAAAADVAAAAAAADAADAAEGGAADGAVLYT
jgi:hypothetical protein